MSKCSKSDVIIIIIIIIIIVVIIIGFVCTSVLISQEKFCNWSISNKIYGWV